MNILWTIACALGSPQAIAIISGAIISGLMLGFSYRLIKANMPQRVKCFFGCHSTPEKITGNAIKMTITKVCPFCNKVSVKHVKRWKTK